MFFQRLNSQDEINDILEPFPLFTERVFMPFENFNNRLEDSFSELNRRQRIFNIENSDSEEHSYFYIRRNSRNHIQIERPELKEIKSNNENFIDENDIKFNLYPLYINWKKIESKSIDNNYFNIFKLFGYFGEAIYEILIESCPKVDNNNNNYYNHKNFISELSKLYKKEYTKEAIEENNFYIKIMDIKEDVISLARNKIIIFKEIPIFLILFKFYQAIYTSLKDKKNIIESLKYQFIILSYIKNDEYDTIYDKYLKKFKIGRYLGFIIFQRNKEEYIKHIKKDYKNLS